MNWQEIFPQILLAVLAASPGAYAIWRGRHKERADVAKIITEAAGDLLTEYKEKLDSLERLIAEQQEEIRCLEFQSGRQIIKLASQAKELEEQAGRIGKLEEEKERVLKGVEALTEQIRKLGHEPVWEPNNK